MKLLYLRFYVPRLAFGLGGVAIPAFLAVIASIIGAIYGCIASCSWDESGAPDVTIATQGPVQVGFGYFDEYEVGVDAYFGSSVTL